MSKITQLFSKGGNFFVFALLEILCLYLIITHNSEQRAIALESWSLYSSKVTNRYSDLLAYIDIKDQLEEVKEENARLRAQLPAAFETKITHPDTITDDSLRQRFTFLPANIVSKSMSGYNNTYVLDIGRIHGVELHQGVLCPNGVLGVVTQVTSHYSRVMSILHRNSRISAGIQKNKHFGALTWNTTDARYAQLNDVPRYVEVAKGDTIETTGFSHYFPTGIPIGVVDEDPEAPGGTNWRIKVRLFEDYRTVQQATVVRDLFKNEIEELGEE